MQHVDDDMNELVRLAAADYPLRLQKNDWETIAGRLRQPASFIPSAKDKTEGQGRGLSTLLFLVSFLLAQAVAPLQHNRRAVTLEPEILNHAKRIPLAKMNLSRIGGSESFSSGQAKDRRLVMGAERMSVLSRSKTATISKVSEDQPQPFIPSSLAPGSLAPGNLAPGGLRTGVLQSGNGPVPSPVMKKPGVAFLPDHRSYIGLLAGPQFNNIRNQGFNRAGFSLGVMTGFWVGKKWAIETGVLFTEKRYYTSGVYFNIDKIRSTMPAGMTIMSLNGRTDLFEIPLKLRFDLLRTSKRTFFASAGTISTILIRENNSYLAAINGNQEIVSGRYTDPTGHFFTAATISVGYEQHLTNRSSFRIEPYVQLPTKGLGVGAMSVLSAGVHFGYTIPVFR